MNEDKFTGKAELYAKYRPSYPAELIDWLYEKSGTDTVADIGAGTGIFTRCLAQKPWKITAVEPNSDMFEQLKANAEKNINIVNASAENTGIVDNSIGLITAAQAFHWFDEDKFKAECKRILTDKGALAIIWNSTIPHPLENELNELCMKYCGMCRAGKNRVDNNNDDYLLSYIPNCNYYKFDNAEHIDKSRFVGEVLSRSYAPLENDKCYNNFQNELCELFDKHCIDENGIKCVVIPRISTCYYYSNVKNNV